MNNIRINLSLVLCGVLVVFLFSEAQAEIPTKLEPNYSEAVLAYNGRDYNKSLQILEQLVRTEPKIAEFLELKALTLKMMHNEKGSAQVYLDLIRVKTAEGKKGPALAPYSFELGVIRFHEENLTGAKKYLEFSLAQNFNPIPSRFFLAMIAFKDARWSDAEEQFRKVTEGDLHDLLAASYFYLGQIYFKLGIPRSATEYFNKARIITSSEINNPDLSAESRHIAKQIFDATQQALKPFDQSGFFGSISLLTAEDTNVLLQGSGVTTSTTSNPSGKSTIKETMLANLGYSTSPLDVFQFVSNYRGTINLNFNSETQNGEYFVNELSFYLTKGALEKTSYGLKLGGIYTMQDQPTTTNARNFINYSSVLSVGPYYKYELWPKVLMSLEANISPQYFTGDSSLSTASTLRRSGVDSNARFSLKNDKGSFLFNPGLQLNYDYNNSDGTEFRSTSYTLELSDVIHWSDKLNFNLSANLSWVGYSRDPSPTRSDIVLILDLNGLYRLSQKFGILADLQYTNDTVSSSDSTAVSQYQYNRFVGSLGFSYNI